MRYLAQKYPSLNKFYDGDFIHKQEIDAMIDFRSTVYRPAMVSGVAPKFQMVMRKLKEPTPEFKMMLDAAPEKIKSANDALEAHLTKKGTKFVNGDAPSIADFMLYAEFGNFFYMGMEFK